ncbi:MAG: class I SAM-dependent methyltransferase [Vicinamibacteria bacterium]
MLRRRRSHLNGKGRQRTRSRTAEVAAAFRAYHLIRDRPAVFEDPIAVRLIGPYLRILVTFPFLSRLLFERGNPWILPLRGQVMARARYAEDRLAGAIARGTKQYVIVGAGLDSFALRRTELRDRLQVFELDHPASQQWKLSRIRAAGFTVPENLKFVPVDFEKETIAEALLRSEYRRGEAAFFSWLGTTYYISREAVMVTLKSIASIAAPGSEIVFDYGMPEERLGAQDRRLAAWVKRRTARVGEPITTFFDPEDLSRDLENLGLKVLENLTGEEQRARYFAGRTDGLTAPDVSLLISVGVRI